MSGPLTPESAQYIVGYVTKKLTRKDDPRLEGKHPEFARMSRMPGIGTNMVQPIADSLRRFNLDASEADVPVGLRHGKKVLPLGRFLRGKLRKELYGDEKAPENVQSEYSLKMLSLQQESKDTGKSPKEILKGRNYQKVGSAVYRHNLKKRKD